MKMFAWDIAVHSRNNVALFLCCYSKGSSRTIELKRNVHVIHGLNMGPLVCVCVNVMERDIND